MTDNHARATEFRALHKPGEPLILVNAWDAASARVIAAAGAPAIASTSAGVAWSLGAADGDNLGREAAVALVRRLTAAVSVPVTADIEAGYGDAPADVADTIRQVIDAGAVGVNIEDADHRTGGLRDISEHCARIAAVRGAADEAGVRLFINARIDTYLRGSRDEAETMSRAKAFADAGADGIFVPGVVDLDVVARLIRSISAPFNVLVGPGAPSVSEFASIGVARVSLGSAVAQAAYGLARRAAIEAISAGTYSSLDDGFDFSTLNALMSGGPATARR